MILVDTSIWVDHFRTGEKGLVDLMNAERVLTHPFIIGELALAHLPNRQTVLRFLAKLPEAITAREDEALHFIEKHALASQGIGYVDAQILASAQLTIGARLWTRDKRLLAVAGRMGLSMQTAAPLN